ncbi:efflux transporter outer membrane subunit [Novosphingobium sp. PASSN1]|uniref:efflux transporter outer membrane subunit n=1 Tax=Novosphingobium sp. PASSN1 TaxID=2015561 RepID=UPI000BCE7318|nr:efflux transporter outer membrane subunit [Novosphingobium sp. PASSN1]OYU35157.1 MAG: multidrug transporter [Novosphingobium sp. PASSN1]
MGFSLKHAAPAIPGVLRHAALLVGCAALAGCATMPDLGPKPALRDPATLGAAPAAPEGNWPGDGWWKDYGDPQMAALIEEALAGSPTLAGADARARKAAAYATSAGAALLPSLTANGQVTGVKQSYNNGFPAQFVPKGLNDTGRVSLDLGYELDFFGKNRAALRAATSEREAAQIEARAARLALATSVAAAYADLARLAAEREVQVAAVQQREEVAALVARRVISGLDTRGEQRQAEAGVPLARGDLAATDEAIALTRNRLAALLGAGPERGAAIALPAPHALAAPGLPANLALDLIGRRADIAAARLRAEAAGARITTARAGFYPNVNLLGLIGLQSFGLGNLTAKGSDIAQAGAAISLPIFSGGRIEGQYRAARADYDEAVAQYDQTLVRALNDVADAAASSRALGVRQAEARAALVASEEAYAIARRRYEGGLSPYLAVLTAQDALLRNRQLVAAVDARALTLTIELIRALGGGYGAKA